MIRKDAVNILRYLPEYLSKDIILKKVSDAQSDEHDKQRLALIELINNLFIETATWGLNYWEKMLDLPINNNYSYESRRKKILSKLNNNITVNKAFLTELINLFVADNLGKIEEHPEKYSIDILIPDNKVMSFDDLDEAIKTYIPAHIGWKYIAFAKSKGYFYLGGVISKCKTINIRANSEFNININEITTNNTIGIVSMAKIINIPANYYE